MKTLILHSTEISQWHALINEAQVATNLILNENMESYLVFLLMRFSHGPKLIESVLALDFLAAQERGKRQRLDLLRDLGDKSLLFCGLFPGLARKKQVSMSYFIDIGQAAYLSISALRDYNLAALYGELGQHFINLSQVLQALREEPEQSPFPNTRIMNTFNARMH